VKGDTGDTGPAGDPATDDQTLSSNGNPGYIAISGGNNITLNTDDDDADDSNELQTLSKLGNTITLSISGGSVTETKTSISQNTSTGVITHASEDGTSQSVNVISANANNGISAGTDGGAYFYNPIKAYGKYSSGTNVVYSAGLSAFSIINTGRYRLTFATARSSSNYVVQLTLLKSSTQTIHLYVAQQTTTYFDVYIRNNDAFPDQYSNQDFYFTVLE
jgi:hypothetical protein